MAKGSDVNAAAALKAVQVPSGFESSFENMTMVFNDFHRNAAMF